MQFCNNKILNVVNTAIVNKAPSTALPTSDVFMLKKCQTSAGRYS